MPGPPRLRARCSDLVTGVIERDGGKVQLSVLGKGQKRREVLLPEFVSRSLPIPARRRWRQ
jgi:hypothetical protein